jgi:hypothetical protein
MIQDLLQQFQQANRGEKQGTIWATKNIDPRIHEDNVQVSRVFGYNISSEIEEDLEYQVGDVNQPNPPSGFAFTEQITGANTIFATIGLGVWGANITNKEWTLIDNRNCSINSDIIAFNDAVYVATKDGLDELDLNADWSQITTLADSPHSFTIYGNRLYVSDDQDKVYSMTAAGSASKTGSYTIQLESTTGADQTIVKIAAVSDGIWIATLFTNKMGGEMIFWDGVSENIASARYELPSGALAMTIKDDRPYVIDALGRLRVFDGTTFPEVARFPIYDEQLKDFNNDSNNRWIHPNGMIVIDEEIHVLVSNEIDGDSGDEIENLPAGIWAWNPTNGLYHKHSFVPALITGGGQTVSSFGLFNLNRVGALFNGFANGSVETDADERTTLWAGVSYDTDTTHNAIGIVNYSEDINKAGYFVSNPITATTFDDVWKEIVPTYHKFSNLTDKVVIKYRVVEDTPIYADGYWSDNTILRSNDDLSDVENGDEVEILTGTGAGLCATITSITGQYRIQLDANSLTGMTGDCRFRIQKWIKLESINDIENTFKRITIGDNSDSIQFKVYMEGVGSSPRLKRLISVSSEHAQV